MRHAVLVLLASVHCFACSSSDDADSGPAGATGTTATSGDTSAGTMASTTMGSSTTTESSTSAASTSSSSSSSSGGASSTGSDATSATTGATDGASSSAGGATSTDAASTTLAAGGTGGGASSELGFFVSSDTSETGDLGGLAGADARCQALAEAVGAGDRTWRAYLSVESDPDNSDMPTHARDRIGQGPWQNAAGVVLANDLSELHSLSGDAELFLDENGERINGQWEGSPTPNQHDILTGSDADGNVMTGSTCDGWTSDSGDMAAQIGHSDGLGPNQNGDPPYNSWNSSHENGGCDDTAPLGGAGRIYCFAAD